jgi:hypothetical protein
VLGDVDELGFGEAVHVLERGRAAGQGLEGSGRRGAAGWRAGVYRVEGGRLRASLAGEDERQAGGSMAIWRSGGGADERRLFLGGMRGDEATGFRVEADCGMRRDSFGGERRYFFG